MSIEKREIFRNFLQKKQRPNDGSLDADNLTSLNFRFRTEEIFVGVLWGHVLKIWLKGMFLRYFLPFLPCFQYCFLASSPVTSTKKTAEILLCGFFVATKRCSCRHLILPYALFAVKIFWGLPNTVPLPKSRKARPESIRFRGAPSVPNILRDGPVSRVLSSAVIYLGVSSPIRSSGVHGGIRAGNPYEYRPTLHRTGFTWHGALPSRR